VTSDCPELVCSGDREQVDDRKLHKAVKSGGWLVAVVSVSAVCPFQIVETRSAKVEQSRGCIYTFISTGWWFPEGDCSVCPPAVALAASRASCEHLGTLLGAGLRAIATTKIHRQYSLLAQ